MQTEIEAKWLNIDKETFRKQLDAAGARLVSKERKMVRYVFDFPDRRLEKVGAWVRVRDEADRITMSYKQLSDRTIHGTKEVSLTVDNDESARSFLNALGLECNSVQETMRESWKLGDADIEIDTWPWIPTFVEIEAKSELGLHEVARLLGLAMDEALHGSVETAYQAVYNVSEAEVDSWPEIRFGDVPDWLVAKKK